jgi:hypothetical protein
MRRAVACLLFPVAALAGLSGCGPQDEPATIPIAVAPEDPLPGPPTAVTVQQAGPSVPVTGQFLFTKPIVPVDGTGRPDVAARRFETRPVRAVDVTMLDSTTLQAIVATATDDTGAFAVQMPRDRSFLISVSSTTRNAMTRVDQRVVDPLLGTPYALMFESREGGPFSTGAPPGFIRIALPILPFTFVARPDSGIFNILDVGLRNHDRVRAILGRPLTSLTWAWSPVPSSGSFYVRTATGPIIRVLGGDSDVDNTDEFDDAVLSHEYGHFLVDEISRDSSRGGAHNPFTDVLYPTLAQSEGIADALSGIFQSSPFFLDTARVTGVAPRAAVFNLEDTQSSVPAPPGLMPRGERSEATVSEVIWDLFDGLEQRNNADAETVGLPFSQVLPVLSTLAMSSAYLVLQDFLAAVVSTGAAPLATVQALLGAPVNQRVTFTGAGDTFPPPVGVPSTTPGAARTRCDSGGACFDSANDALDESNRFLRFTLAGTRNVSISMTLTGGDLPSPAGTNVQGTNLDLFLMTPENDLARTVTGNVLTPFPRPEGAAESLQGLLDPGTYILYVDAAPERDTNGDGIADQLSNTSSVSVTFAIEVQ